LVRTSRTPNARLEPSNRRYRGPVTLFNQAGADQRQLRVTWLAGALAVLVGLTMWVVALVSIWWAAAYLALMAIIVVTPGAGRRVTSSTSAVKSTGSKRASLDQGLRADQIADATCYFPTFSQETGPALAALAEDLFEHRLDSAEPDALKSRRARARARKVAKAGAERGTSSVSVAWIRVGPGKFIRADANVPVVAAVQSERTEESSGPVPCAPPAVEFSYGSGSRSDGHGIAPSAISEFPSPNSLLQDQGCDEPAALGEAEGSLVFNDGATLLGAWHALTPEGCRLAAWLSRGKSNRVSRSQAVPNAIRASSRHVLIPRLTSGTFASSWLPANVRSRQAAQRAFGRIAHVHRTVCCRSPPSVRQVEARVDSSGWAFQSISIASP
jgi:hypothetical protein